MTDTTQLLDFVASMGGERALRIEENLGAGYVRLRVAEAKNSNIPNKIIDTIKAYLVLTFDP